MKKSPLNRVGNKFKQLDFIYSVFDKSNKIKQDNMKFLDLFVGGGDVVANIPFSFVEKIGIDRDEKIIGLFNYIKANGVAKTIEEIDDYIALYNLSKTNKEGFLQARTDYNNKILSGIEDYSLFFTVVAYSFNNDIRFNSKGLYNMSFGLNRSSFNDTMRANFINFFSEIEKEEYSFESKDFREMQSYIYDNRDNLFVYLDPPYLISYANYNKNQGGWTIEDEKDLLDLVSMMIEEKIDFVLSNVTEHKGEENEILVDFINKNKLDVYRVYSNYSNCNYALKEENKQSKTKEYLIYKFN